MKSVIILDGHLKSALSAVRSLGRQRVPIVCGAERGTGMAMRSRYVHDHFTYPSPLSHQVEFISVLKKIAIRADDKPVIFSFSDATTLTLFQFRKELTSCATLLFASEQSMEIAFNKAATYSEAKITGVPTIPTYLPERADEIPRITSGLTYPAVIKPRHSATWPAVASPADRKEGVGVTGTAEFVFSESELMDAFSKIKSETGEPPLVQPYVDGEEYGVELLVKDGEVLVEAAHHRLRSLSPTGGASVLKETIGDSETFNTMREHAHTLARVLSWTGPMMVEFKVDSDTRGPLLMEINGRFWGSLPLSIMAEIDFPYLHYALAAQQPLPNSRAQARAGVVSRHWLGDLLHLFRVWFARDRMRSIAYPKRMKALKDFFSYHKGAKSDVWTWHDPLPSLFQYIDVINKVIKS